LIPNGGDRGGLAQMALGEGMNRSVTVRCAVFLCKNKRYRETTGRNEKSSEHMERDEMKIGQAKRL
jgi:hypothetical protein